jgi:hypothetical protein
MPKGPQGQKRPADVIGNAVRVMRLATGEEEETLTEPSPKRAKAAQRGGLKGGRARAQKLTAEERREAAQKAASHRWAASVTKPDND